MQTSSPVEEESTPGFSPLNYLPVKIGQVLGSRYRIIAKLGYGTTSTVWLVKDLQRWKWLGDKFYTLKVLTRDLTKSQDISELKISQILKRADPWHGGFQHVRIVQDSFFTEGPAGSHMCLLYETMRENITTFQSRLVHKRIPPDLLKSMVSIFLKGLDYLHACEIIHTDLKPDNILIGVEHKKVLIEMEEGERSAPTPKKKTSDDYFVYFSRNFGDFRGVPGRPKISDLGLGVLGSGPHHHSIQPDLFQAPEVILCAGWSYSADIWNLGVMLWDLLEGRTLFTAEDPADGRYRADLHLEEISAFLGSPPNRLLLRGLKSKEYFSQTGEYVYKLQQGHLINARAVQLISPGVRRGQSLTLGDTITTMDGENKNLFLDFIAKMLTWLPEDRATAKDLLSHPWLTS